MTWPKVLPNDDGIRPAGPSDECFYCQAKVREAHAFDCVTIHKKVRVRYIFDIEVEVPYVWDKQQFEFHRNESTWCANNAIDELQAQTQECLCPYFKAEFLEDVDNTPIQKTKDDA